MSILDLERQVIKLRQDLTRKQASHDAEMRRIAAELGFPLGGFTIEQIITEIRRLTSSHPCWPFHATEPKCTRTDLDHVRRFHPERLHISDPNTTGGL